MVKIQEESVNLVVPVERSSRIFTVQEAADESDAESEQEPKKKVDNINPPSDAEDGSQLKTSVFGTGDNSVEN